MILNIIILFNNPFIRKIHLYIMDPYQCKTLDLFEYQNKKLLDFFIKPVDMCLNNSYRRGKISLKLSLEEKHYIVIYLAGILSAFVFHEKNKKEKRGLINNLKKKRHDIFANYFLSKFNADIALMSSSSYDISDLYIEFNLPTCFFTRIGQVNYDTASHLIRKISGEEDPHCFIFDRLSKDFKNYSNVIKDTFEEIKIKKEDLVTRINCLLDMKPFWDEKMEKRMIFLSTLLK